MGGEIWYTQVATLAEAAQMWGLKNKQSLLYKLFDLERRVEGSVFVYKSAGTWLVYLPAMYRLFGMPKNGRKVQI